MRLLYFSWVREKIGASDEDVAVPDSVITIADLIGWLAGQSTRHADALAEPARLRAAIDQDFVGMDTAITGAREIALFPPVTGG